MIDHCIAAFKKSQEEKLYRMYVTDALKEAHKLNIRYEDLLKPPEVRTAEEIISNIKGGLERLGGHE